ncbi:hypothetical protein ABPG75_013680 [Micractinium tetrahymenae]
MTQSPPNASGSASASPSDVAALAQQICNDTRAAAKQFVQMVAAAALQKSDTDCNSASNKAYDYAVSAVKSDDPADIPTATEWFTKFAVASDALGIPACITLTIIDPKSEQVLWTETIHTGSQL